jgi:hypothetical protein
VCVCVYCVCVMVCVMCVCNVCACMCVVVVMCAYGCVSQRGHFVCMLLMCAVCVHQSTNNSLYNRMNNQREVCGVYV